MVRETSIEAYEELLSTGAISRARARVLRIFMEAGDLTGGGVSKLVHDKYGSPSKSETVRNRITELRDLGLLVEKGYDEDPFTGRKSILFGLNPNPPPVRKLPKRESLRKKLSFLEQENTRLRDLLVRYHIEF